MKQILLGFINLNQSAFVEGRNISDNILLAHELVHNYHRPCVSAKSAIKIDLFKAFDSLSWDFILNLLEAVDFPACFIKWLRGCLTSTWFSVSVNGTLAGYFQGKKGVRQGDPLSPYIFVMTMEVLT